MNNNLGVLKVRQPEAFFALAIWQVRKKDAVSIINAKKNNEKIKYQPSTVNSDTSAVKNHPLKKIIIVFTIQNKTQ